MFEDATILRLFLSQAFATYYILILVPIKKPQKQNTLVLIFCALLITLFNAFIISNISLSFYIRFYFLTLLLPYVIMLSYFSIHKGSKLFFALLTVQVVGNLAIINGLFASYIFYGQNFPLLDTVARVLTYIIFLPIIIKFVRPTYIKMIKMLNKGWWVLNSSLILSYALAYFILFVPSDIFKRPEYFIHAYIGIILSLLIYIIIFFLFIEIQLKVNIERDKQILSNQMSTLSAKSVEITNIAYKDSLTGINNRYSLLERMDTLIKDKQYFQLIFIDLDKLKIVNDTYSHSKGDTYLKQFALAVTNVIQNQGEVYRYAGDEFVCLMTEKNSIFNKDKFKDNIANAMDIDTPYYGISLGLAIYPKDGLTTEELISVADEEMYKDKKTKSHHR